MDNLAAQFQALSSTDPLENWEHKVQTKNSKDILQVFPTELILQILGSISFRDLLPLQQLSKQFRVLVRITMLDRISGRASRRHCRICQRQEKLQHLAVASAEFHHVQAQGNSNGSSNVAPTEITTATYSQAGHPSSSSSSPSSSSSSSASITASEDEAIQSRSHSHHQHDPEDEPFSLLLSLFPHHDHPPTAWQIHQWVPFRCQSVDRKTGEIFFEPLDAHQNYLYFAKSAWSSGIQSFGPGGGLSYTVPPTPPSSMPTTTSPPPPQAGTFQSSSSTSSTSSSTSTSTRSSISSVSSMQDSTSSSSIPYVNTRIDSAPGFSTLSNLHNSGINNLGCLNLGTNPNMSFLPSLRGAGDQYSVIGVTCGDWPASDTVASGGGRWWGGGIHMNVAQEPMLSLPWTSGKVRSNQQTAQELYSSATMTTRAGIGSVEQLSMPLPDRYLDLDDFGDGSIRERKLRVLNGTGSGSGSEAETNLPSPPSASSSSSSSSSSPSSPPSNCLGTPGHECGQLHYHQLHQYFPKSRHSDRHPRHLCLHHAQPPMMFRNAGNTSAGVGGPMGRRRGSSLVSDEGSEQRPQQNHVEEEQMVITAGSGDLSVDYSIEVKEAEKCSTCMSSPCKASKTVHVRFRQVRVSLDWILSGFHPSE